MKWSRPQAFRVLSPSGIWYNVRGYVSEDRCWGIHGHEDWTLSHIPTGRVIGHLHALEMAKGVADFLWRHAIDWSIAVPHITNCARKDDPLAEMYREVQRFIRDLKTEYVKMAQS